MKANPNFVLAAITIILLGSGALIAANKDSTVTMVIVGMVTPTLLGLLAMLRAGDAAINATNAAKKADNAAVAAAKAVGVVTGNALENKEVQKTQSKQLEVIHTMVNDLSTRSLSTIADQAERIAKLTGNEDDRIAADSARKNYEAKVKSDIQASSQKKGHNES